MDALQLKRSLMVNVYYIPVFSSSIRLEKRRQEMKLINLIPETDDEELTSFRQISMERHMQHKY